MSHTFGAFLRRNLAKSATKRREKSDLEFVSRFGSSAAAASRCARFCRFQVFDPLDFLAEATQHIPDPGEHLIRYYGWYSNKNRGLRGQAAAQPEVASVPAPAAKPTAKEARKRWAA